MTMRKQQKGMFGDAFHRGAARRLPVVERDYPCEYSLTHYLAAATAGEDVAVGYLHCDVPMTVEQYEQNYPGEEMLGEPFWSYQIPMVILPQVGVWVCEPLFADGKSAMGRLKSAQAVVEKALGCPLSALPVYSALFAVLEDVRPDLRGIDPGCVYDITAYGDVPRALRARMGDAYEADTVDACVVELLQLGRWTDEKDAEAPWQQEPWPIPAWLADLIGNEHRQAA